MTMLKTEDVVQTYREIYTTGEAAAICGVSQQTIIRSFDKGDLKGFRVPGSRFRRIPHMILKEFMEKSGLPLDRLPQGPVEAKEIKIVFTENTSTDIVEWLVEAINKLVKTQLRSNQFVLTSPTAENADEK